MTLLRNKAVQKLQVAHPRLNPVKQIAIARKYCCDELVKEPFEMLVAREEGLSREEIAELPLEDLHGLIVRREALLRENGKPTTVQCDSCTRTSSNGRKWDSCGITEPEIVKDRPIGRPATTTTARRGRGIRYVGCRARLPLLLAQRRVKHDGRNTGLRGLN